MLVLASTSPWRIGMLKSAGIPAEGVAPPIDEYSITADEPVQLAIARAHGKAASVVALRPEAWVIGADQVCWMDQDLFEKPKSPEEHLDQLKRLSGRRHTLSTAVSLFLPGGREYRVVEHSYITLRSLPEVELRAYIASGEGSACAGGYQAEAKGALLIERIEGDWHNVIGLPLFAVISLLRQQGWKSSLLP